MEKIFINLASFVESELIPTVKDLLKQASDPSRLHFSIVEQDLESNVETLQELIDEYGATMTYQFLTLDKVTGACLPRSMAQTALSLDYEYCLHIDSHTRATEEWDNELIRHYNEEGWKVDGKYIYSGYPKKYGYVDDLQDRNDATRMSLDEDGLVWYGNYNNDDGIRQIVKSYIDELGEIRNKTKDWNVDLEYRNHQHFCGGFAFGRTEHFLDVLYDPNYCFEGEETSMSIRFLHNKIKIIEPYVQLFFHDYDGNILGRRPTWFIDQGEHFEDIKKLVPMAELNAKSAERLSLFLGGFIDEPYGVPASTVKQYKDTYAS
jgi:hypothetical protein